MNADHQTRTDDAFAGYFASVILALIISSRLAGVLVEQIAAFSDNSLSASWHANMTAGLFLGIVAANPFNALSSGSAIWWVCLKLGAGFVMGLLIQIWVFTPFTGDGMSNYLFLLLASLGIPAMMLKGWVHSFMMRRGLVPEMPTSKLVSGFLNWSDRSVFVFLMGLSYAGFIVYAAAAAQVVGVLIFLLGAMVITIARREPTFEVAEDLVEADLKIWLELDPEKPTIDIRRDVTAKLIDILSKLLPGAIVFGAMMYLAVQLVGTTYPDAVIASTDPFQSVRTLAMMAASGVAALLVGVMGILGICLAVLRVTAWVQNWSPADRREKYIDMIRLMYFRPISRYWDQDADAA